MNAVLTYAIMLSGRLSTGCQERGFSSLFDYAVRELGYSDAAAARRIGAMRLCPINRTRGRGCATAR